MSQTFEFFKQILTWALIKYPQNLNITLVWLFFLLFTVKTCIWCNIFKNLTKIKWYITSLMHVHNYSHHVCLCCRQSVLLFSYHGEVFGTTASLQYVLMPYIPFVYKRVTYGHVRDLYWIHLSFEPVK